MKTSMYLKFLGLGFVILMVKKLKKTPDKKNIIYIVLYLPGQQYISVNKLFCLQNFQRTFILCLFLMHYRPIQRHKLK